MWDSVRHNTRLNILDYSRIAACLSASLVSAKDCLSSLHPLGKHFYQNTTRCCLQSDTYTRMTVNSCHIQVKVTTFGKHDTPLRFNSLSHTSHSEQDQDISVHQCLRSDNGLPISSVHNLPTPKNLNLQFGVSPVWRDQQPGPCQPIRSRAGASWPMRGRDSVRSH